MAFAPQNSCCCHRSTGSGGAMKNGLCSIRSVIEGQGGSQVTAVGEYGTERGVSRG